MREGICALLEAEPDFLLTGQAKTGREAVEMARRLAPDVIVMDIAMPMLNGLEATRQILETDPAARVLILSAHSDHQYIDRVNAVGAAGFMEKQMSKEMLARAIREVAKGNKFASPSIAIRMRAARKISPGWASASRLTSREAEVLQLVAEGAANKQVAAELSISVKTVEKHRQHLMDKLAIHDTASLTRYAIAAGVIESSIQPTTTQPGGLA
jgi:DNA-binding NarL/FixJ family response regulator